MSPSDNRSLKICSLNARSLRNKSAAFVELVNDLKADLFTICETWLSVNDSAILNELTPTGYNTLYHCPRSGRRGGGTALLVRNGYVTSKISCIEKSSFKVSEWLVDVRSTELRIVIIYRPPSSPVHPVLISTFFAEFSDYLESVVMSSEPLVLLGDFNIHVDVPTDMDAIQFRDLLDSMGLQQHVKRPFTFMVTPLIYLSPVSLMS